MRAVLDVGQYVSALINPHGHPGQILTAWKAGAFELVTSQPILDDLTRVLTYPHIKKRQVLDAYGVQSTVDFIGANAVVTPGLLQLPIIPSDPTDEKIIACAMEGGAQYVVASDHHLLQLGSFAGISVIPPRKFLELLAII